MKVGTMDLSLSNSSPMVATADHEKQGQAAHRRYGTVKSRTVVEFASGKDHA